MTTGGKAAKPSPVEQTKRRTRGSDQTDSGGPRAGRGARTQATGETASPPHGLRGMPMKRVNCGAGCQIPLPSPSASSGSASGEASSVISAASPRYFEGPWTVSTGAIARPSRSSTHTERRNTPSGRQETWRCCGDVDSGGTDGLGGFMLWSLGEEAWWVKQPLQSDTIAGELRTGGARGGAGAHQTPAWHQIRHSGAG